MFPFLFFFAGGGGGGGREFSDVAYGTPNQNTETELTLTLNPMASQPKTLNLKP